MDDLLDVETLTADVHLAPDWWLRGTLERLDDVRRADRIVGAEQWALGVVHDRAARAFDVLLVELGRRVADREAA